MAPEVDQVAGLKIQLLDGGASTAVLRPLQAIAGGGLHHGLHSDLAQAVAVPPDAGKAAGLVVRMDQAAGLELRQQRRNAAE